MLVIGLLVLILIVLVSHGRWRYFQANPLPNGKRVNYGKYAFFGVVVALIGLLGEVAELLALGALVWAIGPYVELEIAQIKAERNADDPNYKPMEVIDDPNYKSPGAFSLIKHAWKSGGIPKEPKDPQE